MRRIISILIISMMTGINGYAGVSVSPVQLYINESGKQRSTTLTIESVDETEKRIFEVKAARWTQDEKGENVLTDDESIIINPKSFILDPNKQQTIRIGFSQPVSSILEAGKEKSWRILLEEMPQTVKENTVNFLFNFNLPLFVGKQDPVKLNFKHSGNHLTVTNDANSHVQITTLKIVDALKKEIFTSGEMSYLLANKSYNYDLGNTKLNKSSAYTVQLTTGKDDKVIEFKIPN